jgi:hypothetical protein
MTLPPTAQFVADSWGEIISISRTERIEIERNKKHFIYHLPTLEKLESWMENQEWDACPLDSKEFFRLVSIFHSAYINKRLR